MKKNNVGTILLLNLLLMVYSLSGVCSKYAAGEAFLSIRFLLFYGAVIFLLGIYAVFWQQIIKRLPLTVAFANKAVSLIWAMIWGVVFFQERITAGKAAGAGLIIGGIILFAVSDANKEEK